jgi:hypothetical protein
MMNFEMDREKEKLINILSEQYAQDLITIDEYERLLEFVNKTETNKEIEYIKKIIDTNETYVLKATNQSVEKENSNNIILMILKKIFRKNNIRKIKIFSGNYELKLHDIDFVENLLTIKLTIFSGDVIIYIFNNTAVENDIKCFSGKINMSNQNNIRNEEIKNKLILKGNIFDGNLYIVYEK